MAAKKTNLPKVNFSFVRDSVTAISARENVVAQLTARKDELTKDRDAKLQAFFEALAGGMIGFMQKAGTHASYAETTDKLIAACVADVRKVYEDKTQEHLDKAERKALAKGRTYASRYFADAGVEHPFPRAKKGTGKKAAAKADKATPAPAAKASAKVTAGAANVKAPTGLEGDALDQNLREQIAIALRTFKGCAKKASARARDAAALLAQADKLLAGE